jgi:histidyl-tRNA synthetase
MYDDPRTVHFFAIFKKHYSNFQEIHNLVSDLIKPRTLRGFRDYLPATMLERERLIETAKRIYRSYGFSPIDTPALEYTEILLGKGGDETDKQLYRFKDNGNRDVALRFDLTIPFARFAAQHYHEIGTPFKRYHIGTVWRGENTQKGRYREFMQCDFDTIGTESNLSDIETLLVIHDLMHAIGFERFTIRVNNRLVLNGLLEMQGLQDKSVGVLRALDKLPKIGRAKVVLEMTERAGTTEDQANNVLDLAELNGTSESMLADVEKMLAGNEAGELGVARLRELFNACAATGVPEDRIELDLSIARGLDYYTGTIYETFLSDQPEIGSVCSGGRYDNLAEMFTKNRLPGVGASLGLDRLLAAMEMLGMLKTTSTPAEIFVACFDPERLNDYLALAARLRKSGFGVEVYPEVKAIGKQLKYANKKGHRLAIIAGANEFDSGVWQVKNLQAREQADVPDDELEEYLQSKLN